MKASGAGPAVGGKDAPNKKAYESSNCQDLEQRVAQRQKQIDFGKNTVAYTRYLEKVPRDARKRGDPMTPDPREECSKRAFDGKVREWRRKLHDYDPAGQEEGLEEPVPLAGQRRPAESEPEPLRPAQRSRSDVGAAAAPPAEQRSAGAQPSAQQAPLVKGAGATTAGAGAKPAEAAAAAVGKGAGAASSAGPPSGRADGDLFGAEDDEFGAL